MIFSGTFMMAVVYVMLLCDNIIAGRLIGEKGVAAVNAVSPVGGVVNFLAGIIAIGSSILYSREIGAMHKTQADRIFGQGVIVTAVISVVSAGLLALFEEDYLRFSGVTGEIYDLAREYYRFTPLNAGLSIFTAYFTQMNYTDGDETCSNVSYALQLFGNLLSSIFLCKKLGMVGIILGTVVGNILGLLSALIHFLKKSNTLHFSPHFSFRDFFQSIEFSVVDSSIYLCWAVADYVLIRHVAANYGDNEQITLAVVFNLLQITLVLKGVGNAVQSLLGIYQGERNIVMVKRLMNGAMIASFLEGLLFGVLSSVFAKQFCLLFGISDSFTLEPSIHAVRVVSSGIVFCGIIALITAYYDTALSLIITILKDGVFYSVLPILLSNWLGANGMWIAMVISPVLALSLAFIYVLIRYGGKRFPYLPDISSAEIIVMDEILSPERCAALSEEVHRELLSRGYDKDTAMKAALFTEEIGLTILEKNSAAKKKKALLLELSLFFQADSVLLIERDSGVVFDITDENLKVDGLSSFIVNGLMESHRAKVYLTTTGYNRNILHFQKSADEVKKY